MFHTLKLLLPAIVPSWRFFDGIAPSPRVQYTLLQDVNQKPDEWIEFRPRPVNVSFTTMLKRMLWNPKWNESLFLVSCAERLKEHPTKHSEDEILNRIIRELTENDAEGIHEQFQYVQFRLVFVKRQDTKLQEEITYHSRIQPLTEEGTQ